MTDLYALAGPLLRLLDPERAHGLAIAALKAGLVPAAATPAASKESPILSVSLWGLNFPNPIGLAAGFDKNGEVVRPMLGQGFGFV
ncbi:MAG: dihydroorotate dehydrogenase (quinone), partial [Rhodospirillales bacterium]|nr:dihydroorotate dehydrogenase (quinone) [Rhodospirillales bacterium]